MKKWNKLALGAVAVATLALSACAPSGESTEDKPTVLRVALSDQPAQAMPHLGSSGSDYTTLYPVFDRLIHFDAESGELLPDAGLATEWGFTDDTNQRFELTIREGVTFHDGEELDAEAVAKNLDFYLHARDIVATAAADLGMVTEVNVLDGNKVELVLSRPFSALPAILADRAGMMVSPASLDAYADDPDILPAGAGQYRWVSWEKGQNWTMERFDDYWNGEPSFEAIEFQMIADASAKYNAFRTGQVDYILDVDPIEAEAMGSEPTVRVEQEPTQFVAAFQLAATQAQFSDERVRQAVNITIDRAAVVRALFPTLGDGVNGLPTMLPVPAQQWAAVGPGAEVVHDVDRAKELMEEAGFADGLDATICIVSADVLSQNAAALYQAQLAEIGVRINIVLRPDIIACNQEATDGKAQGIIARISGRPDPYMNYTFLSGPLAMGATYPSINDLLTEVAAAPDRESMLEAYEELNEEWQKVVPVVMTYTSPLLVGYATDLQGTAATPFGKPMLVNLSW